jgi:hypothetical protein
MSSDLRGKLSIWPWHLPISTFKRRPICPSLIFNLQVLLRCLLPPNCKNLRLSVQEIFRNQPTIVTHQSTSNKCNWKYVKQWTTDSTLRLCSCGQTDLWSTGTVTLTWLKPDTTHTLPLTNQNISKRKISNRTYFSDKWCSTLIARFWMFKLYSLRPKSLFAALCIWL